MVFLGFCLLKDLIIELTVNKFIYCKGILFIKLK